MIKFPDISATPGVPVSLGLRHSAHPGHNGAPDSRIPLQIRHVGEKLLGKKTAGFHFSISAYHAVNSRYPETRELQMW
jgi:hypothetical protein